VDKKLMMDEEELRAGFLAGFKAGKVFRVYRKDVPELEILSEMQSEGLITSELVQYDEQGSYLKFKQALSTETKE